MIRKFKRFLQMRHASRIEPRLREVLHELSAARPELLGVYPVKSGHRGHDSTYYLEKQGKRLAVLRLNNPYIYRPSPKVKLPFVLGTPSQRIAHELAAYTLGMTINLTPEPLWHTKDALVCRYVDRTPLAELNHPRFWDLLRRVNRAATAMHALGLTHMDMSFNNVLVEEPRQYFTFIDFEYIPAPGLNIATQRAYDYLRLLESQWKFVPVGIRGDYAPWLSEIVEHLGADIKEVHLDLLAPALGRILAAPGLGPAIRKAFSR